MGLTATAKGLTKETEFDCGYLTYGTFILELIRVAYGKECRDIFRKHIIDGEGFTQEECDSWRYRYPEFDTTQRWVKVPSQALSDMLVEALKNEEK